MNERLSWRQRLKANLDALPLGGGLDVALPVFRWVRYVCVERRLIGDIRRKIFIRREAERIRSAIRNGARRVVIVYDNLVSPPTYGDYLYIVLLARFFQASGLHVTFYIVDSGYRDDWSALTVKEAGGFIQEQSGLAQVLLRPNSATVQRIAWNDIPTKDFDQSSETVVPFADSVRNRVSTYGEYLTLLNYFLSDADTRLIENVLFSFDSIRSHIVLSPPPKPYITWHCRRSEKWDPNRNVSDADVQQIYSLLRRRYPRHAIVVVSDEVGCDYLRGLAKTYGLDLMFSRDFSSSFLGDGALILGSEFYFQFLGGGISVFPWGSGIPYQTCSPMHRRFLWSGKRAFSWQTAQQQFVNSYSLQYFLRKVAAK